MTRNELARLLAALAISAAAGWVGAWICIASKPQPWPEPLHLLEKETSP